MADNYDNGYNSSDFKRNSNADLNEEHREQDGEGGAKLNEKAGEYMRELLSEKIKLNSGKFPFTSKLIDDEVTRVQASGRVPTKDYKYVDVYREKAVKVVVKVLVPIKEHPKYNFVGQLLGPKGNTLKQLQEETLCKMSILGRGSMRDKKKEEELRTSLDPKYSHLSDELHVEISALAPPAEAHARIAYALAEVKKFLIPEGQEMMRPPPPMMERGGPMRPPTQRGPPRMPGPPPHLARPLPGKAKVLGILDRARSAMDTSYNSYDDPYGAEPPVRGPPRAAPEQDYYYNEREQERYYEDDYYKGGFQDDHQPREYKGTAREVGTRRPAPSTGGGQRAGYRPQPYARPQKYPQNAGGPKKRGQ